MLVLLEIMEIKLYSKSVNHLVSVSTKTDRTTIDDAEDLDLVMPMYRLLECSSNYSNTKSSLWFHSKDEAAKFNTDIADGNNFQLFSYKAKLLRNTAADGVNGILKSTAIAVPL